MITLDEYIKNDHLKTEQLTIYELKDLLEEQYAERLENIIDRVVDFQIYPYIFFLPDKEEKTRYITVQCADVERLQKMIKEENKKTWKLSDWLEDKY